MKLIILICTLFIASCANQLMKKSTLIEYGMSKQELVNTLGVPDNKQFNGNKEAWQYCETGGIIDDYIVIWLINGKVAGTQSYNNHQTGFCSSFFHTINWAEAPGS